MYINVVLILISHANTGMELCCEFLIYSFAFLSFNAIEARTTVALSSIHVPWENAVNSGHQLLNLEYISQHGWDSLRDFNFGEKGLWVAARAKNGPIVSWEGCARWNSSCVSDLAIAGSLADCLRTCQGDSKYILLKGDICRCFEKSETCILRTVDNCNKPCLNNPNDWCGGNYGTETLYSTGPFDNIAFNGTDWNGNVRCIALLQYLDNPKIRTAFVNCENTALRRAICKRNSEVFIGNGSALMNWYEAVELCTSSNAHLYFELPTGSLSTNRSVYWTSQRRGLSIKWTQSTDTEYPFCVSVRLNTRSKLMFDAEDCTRRKRYLKMRDVQNTNVSTSPIVLWPLVFLTMLPLTAVVCLFFVRRRERNNNVTSRPVAEEDHYNEINPDDNGHVEACELHNISAPLSLRGQEAGYDVTGRLQPPRPKDVNYDSCQNSDAFSGNAGYNTVRSASPAKGHATDPTHVYGMNVHQSEK